MGKGRILMNIWFAILLIWGINNTLNGENSIVWLLFAGTIVALFNIGNTKNNVAIKK